MPYKVFAVNEILTAADMNTYVSNQVISTFAGTAARGSAIGTPVAGQFAFLNDTETLTFYSTATSAWEEFTSGGGSGGGGAILINAGTVTESYTFEAGYNGVSAGPVTIVSGATVTVGTASAWSIV